MAIDEHAVILTARKTCARCRQLLPRNAETFGVDSRNRDGLKGRCRECIAAHRKENIDDAREYARNYALRPDQHQKKLERNAAYRAANLERMRAIRAAWKKRNREKERVYSARRREGWITRTIRSALVEELLMEQSGLCRWCSHALGDDFHLDHVVPLSRGGTNDPSNLVLACPPCNTSKGAKTIQEWRPDLLTV